MTGESHPRKETQAEREAAHKTLTKAARRLLLRHGRSIEITPGVTEVYVGLFHAPSDTKIVLAQPYREPSTFYLDLKKDLPGDTRTEQHTSYSSRASGPVQRTDYTRESREEERAKGYSNEDLVRLRDKKLTELEAERKGGINRNPISAQEARDVAKMMTESIVTISHI